MVDAAAGRACVGLIAATLMGWRRLVVVDRDADRLQSARRAVSNASEVEVELREGDVGDPSLWPLAPDGVIAMHACGAASDGVLEASVRARARWIWLVPCCYAHSVPDASRAVELADRLGIPRQPAVRRPFIKAVIDAARTLRLEAAGYEVTVGALVPSSLTPHNLVWQARRVESVRRMQEATRRLVELLGEEG